MGRLAALALAQDGFQVTLFDQDAKDGRQSCGLAAAGMLSPYAELETVEPFIFTLGCQAASQWQVILSKLNQPVFFQRTGCLLIAHNQDKNELLRLQNLLSHKLSHTVNIERLQQAAISALEPSLSSTFSQALYFPEEAHLDPQELFPALQTTLLSFDNLRWQAHSQVTHLAPYQIRCGTHTYAFDRVIDCRGLGSKPDLPTLRGVRGELLCVHAPAVNFQRIIRLIHPRYTIYIAPRRNHHFLIGASVIES